MSERYTIQPARPDDVWLKEPGRWRGATLDGRRTATVSCPGCGQSGSLSGHDISEAGVVTPSLVCPYECGFHEWVTLDGWAATTGDADD